MNAEIILNYFPPAQGDWKALGISAIISLFAIVGQMYASKHLKFMRADEYGLTVAYIGVFLITAGFLYSGVYA